LGKKGSGPERLVRNRINFSSSLVSAASSSSSSSSASASSSASYAEATAATAASPSSISSQMEVVGGDPTQRERASSFGSEGKIQISSEDSEES
jgi:hypothetical protein